MDKKILRERRRRFAAFLMVLVMVIPALGVAEEARTTTDDGQTIVWTFVSTDNYSVSVLNNTGATVDAVQWRLVSNTATCTAPGKATYELTGKYNYADKKYFQCAGVMSDYNRCSGKWRPYTGASRKMRCILHKEWMQHRLLSLYDMW